MSSDPSISICSTDCYPAFLSTPTAVPSSSFSFCAILLLTFLPFLSVKETDILEVDLPEVAPAVIGFFVDDF